MNNLWSAILSPLKIILKSRTDNHLIYFQLETGPESNSRIFNVYYVNERTLDCNHFACPVELNETHVSCTGYSIKEPKIAAISHARLIRMKLMYLLQFITSFKGPEIAIIPHAQLHPKGFISVNFHICHLIYSHFSFVFFILQCSLLVWKITSAYEVSLTEFECGDSALNQTHPQLTER